jgi:hypothetical protein
MKYPGLGSFLGRIALAGAKVVENPLAELL